jgi:ectoine hydroxylase-related dioxygenase (phytanoyl-CoA dioxygenase family)
MSESIRAVTDDEASHFRQNGWAFLPGLITAELAGELLTRLKAACGLDRDTLAADDPDATEVAARVAAAGPPMFQSPRNTDDLTRDVAYSRELGEASARLTGIRPIRLFSDAIMCKLPNWVDSADEIRTSVTPWHQDFCAMPVDRRGAIQIWIALCEITPDMGAMEYISRSHRVGPVGCVQYRRDQDPFQIAPELATLPRSGQRTFQPGDALCHDSLTMHYAQENTTDRIRWVYTSLRIPGNALYTTARFSRTDGLGLKQWGEFDHPNFPVVAD